MDGTTLATGVWPAAVAVAVTLTAVATPILLAAYRRAALRGMAAGDALPDETPGPAPSRRPALATVAVGSVEAAGTAGTAGSGPSSTWARARRSVRHLQGTYAVAGTGFCMTMVAAWMLVVDAGVPISRFAMLFAIYAWPLVLTLAHLGALGRGGWLAYVGSYAVVLAAVTGSVVAASPEFSLRQAGFLWLYANLVPSVLWVVVLNPRIRAAGPLVLAMAMAGSVTSFGVVTAVGQSDAALRMAAAAGTFLGLGAGATLAVLGAVPFLAGIAAGVLALRVLGKRYQRKRLSTQSITLDCLWMLFAFWQPITLVFEDMRFALTGALAIVVYLALRAAALGLWPEPTRPRPARLLLLRVFALDTASQRLFDLWSRSWLRVGSIAMISGPDLATTAIEPHEFLAFLGGRIDRQFITDVAEIDRRLASIDHDADPDGNYRVNDYFCRNHTWRPVVQTLADDADAVLMDLRGFGPGNDGCAWELGQLMERVPLRKVTLLVNPDTNREHLDLTLARRWEQVSADSPNLDASQATIHILSVDALDGANARRILDCAGRTWPHPTPAD